MGWFFRRRGNEWAVVASGSSTAALIARPGHSLLASCLRIVRCLIRLRWFLGGHEALSRGRVAGKRMTPIAVLEAIVIMKQDRLPCSLVRFLIVEFS